MLLIQNSEINQAIKTIEKSYYNLSEPNLYQTYDYAQFLKNNEKFKKSIKYYSKVLQKISNNHELFPKPKMEEELLTKNRKLESRKGFLRLFRANSNQATQCIT